MIAQFSLLVLSLTAPRDVAANTYTVTSLANSGSGTLRAAINAANSHAGADTIAFSPGLIGQTISPTTLLPTLLDPGTTIDGDINNDSLPDIRLDGKLLGAGTGLTINSNSCVVEGLSVTRFPSIGIQLTNSSNCRINGCHLGLNRSGNASGPNGGAQLQLDGSNANFIGEPGKPNYIGAGNSAFDGPNGVVVADGRNNQIQYSFFGLKRNGTEVVGLGGIGLYAYSTGAPVTGTVVRGNVFAGLYTAIELNGADDSRIFGNYIGTTADGLSSLADAAYGIRLNGGASGNRVGGVEASQRNVIGGNAVIGIEITGEGTTSNLVQGNFVGVNRTGNALLPVQIGMVVGPAAGPQTIGGDTLLHGNLIMPNSATGSGVGIHMKEGGRGSTVRNNTFGVFLNGQGGPLHNAGIFVDSSRAAIRDNTFARGNGAIVIGVASPGGATSVQGNLFRNCVFAVTLTGTAQANLGNLGNASTTDDGGNRFGATHTWYIFNDTAGLVRAEGNTFGTTVKADIDAKIWDKLDNGALGLVDYSPLEGGIIPSGGTLGVSGLAATPTARGAEVVFSLSAPGQVTVTVRNLAGRPIATVLQDRPTAAGLQRVTWGGLSSHGTAAPAGTYLVQITARDGAGAQVSAVAPLSLAR